MTTFTPWPAVLGGALIGLSASLLLMLNGRVAGISGIFGGLFLPATGEGERSWRGAFVLGLLLGGLALLLLAPGAFRSTLGSPAAAITSGLLVGVGTRLGNGCTSGHGVCGISRFSTRSVAATATFVGVAMLTVYLRAVLGS